MDFAVEHTADSARISKTKEHTRVKLAGRSGAFVEDTCTAAVGPCPHFAEIEKVSKEMLSQNCEL